VGGLGAAALALTSLAAFSKDHALMINASPSLPYWAIWLDRGALPQRGEIILFDPPASPLLERHFGKEPKPFGKKVSGMPGDIVTEKERSFFVNGRKVAPAKLTSRLASRWRSVRRAWCLKAAISSPPRTRTVSTAAMRRSGGSAPGAFSGSGGRSCETVRAAPFLVAGLLMAAPASARDYGQQGTVWSGDRA
jgi:hypothetical protein